VTETPDQVHGRLNEAMHVAGYAFERAWQKFEWLLEEDRWKQVGSGHEDINAFLSTVQLPKGASAEQRKTVAAKIKALQPEASQRRIAGALGVSNETVRRDLGVTKVTAPEPEPLWDRAPEKPPATYVTLPPEPAGDVVARAVQKQTENKARRVELQQEREQQLEEALQDGAGQEPTLHVSPVGSLDTVLEEESVDAIVTDPPYPHEFVGLFDDLGWLAARVLKPGGSLVVLCGQLYLPEYIEHLSRHLTYIWTLGFHLPGGQAVQIHPHRIQAFWKPALWFAKGERVGPWVSDFVRTGPNENDKRFHHWGQSETIMGALVERASVPGQTVLDPFLGAGTTGVVCKRLGREFVGADKDPSVIELARKRIMADTTPEVDP